LRLLLRVCLDRLLLPLLLLLLLLLPVRVVWVGGHIRRA
jgi:hypothetical protein